MKGDIVFALKGNNSCKTLTYKNLESKSEMCKWSVKSAISVILLNF